ncbi:MAG: glycosyltransferase family 8 protein [Coriobacteriales bacterium]|jgi:lipopolysaccharide biosynthesis glycosyltransferase
MPSSSAARPHRLDVLVTIDENYALPFKVMACSIMANNPGARVTFRLLHGDGLSPGGVASLRAYCARIGAELVATRVDGRLLESAPTTKRYPVEMYFRLLAPFLIEDVDRLIYLDPDTLVINPLEPLARTRLAGQDCFAAACHTGVPEQIAKPINNVRLHTEGGYFNTGVILMDLPRARRIVRIGDISEYVSSLMRGTFLPDQDLFNALYGRHTHEVDDGLWNYDPRSYSQYLVISGGQRDFDWVAANTSVIHFCGSRKPWRSSARTRFEALYAHYMAIERRYERR